MAATRTLEHLPALRPLLARAALTRRKAARPGAGLSADALRVEGVAIDRGDLTAYQRLCGFTADDRLPHTYPHVLGFPLQAMVMSAADFPLPMVGLVHLENVITLHRPLTSDDILDLTVRAERLSPHAKGRTVDLVTEVDVAGQRVWAGRSTYLAREVGDPAAPARVAAPPAPEGFPVARWDLAGDLGRRYAGVSGDVNPIHLSALTARVMGFPAAIAHGMWSYARVLAALGRPAAGEGTSHVWFRKPILLPSTVDLSTDVGGDPLVAALRATRRPEVEHLVLTVTST